MPTMCPSLDDLVRYAQALLSADESSRIGEHLDTCDQCEATVALLEREHHQVFGEAARSASSFKTRPQPLPAKPPQLDLRSLGLRGLRPNDEIGDLRLLHELGSGSFARVFLAQQTTMQRIIAVKISAHPSHEPKLLASLDHPHIVRVFHYDDRALADRGLYLLYMRHVPGCSLQEVMEQLSSTALGERSGRMLIEAIQASMRNKGGETVQNSDASPLHRMDWATAVCWIGARLADALAYAHGRGILHRDIKPANILLMPDGSPLLLDFNIGFGAEVEGSTVEDDFGGSLAYMSPEQLAVFNHRATAASVGEPSDIYSLAVVLFELITGDRPRRTKLVQPSITMVAGGHIPIDPATQGPSLPADCPRGLAATLQRCLVSSPSERCGRAAGVARELQLVTDREVHELLRPEPRSLQAWVARHPMLTLAACSVIPNLIFAALNVIFVDTHLTRDFYKPVMFTLRIFREVNVDYYHLEQLIVNSIVFPAGLSILLRFSRPMCRTLRSIRDGGRPSNDERARGIERCLETGVFAWWLILSLWIGTGIIYPGWNWLANQLTDPNYPDVNVRAFEFISTQIFHGALAASITFLSITFASVQSFLPQLLKDAPALPPASLLERLLGRVELCVWSLPWTSPLAIPAFIFLLPSENQSQTTIVVLCIVFACSLGLSRILGSRIHRHLAALHRALTPTSELLYGRSS